MSSQNLNHEVAAKRIIDPQFLKILDTLSKQGKTHVIHLTSTILIKTTSMKKLIITATILLISSLAAAQSPEPAGTRYISVTGSAEVVVIPDEIELAIVLEEYDRSNKDKVELIIIEEKFRDILRKNNVAADELVFGNSGYYWYYWWSNRRETYQQKSYRIILNSSTDFLSLVQDLDVKGIKSLRISDSSNKELQRLRQEIKISALRAAKEKARYLLESIDEKVGKVISIEEVPEQQNYWRSNQNLLSNVVVATNSSDDEMDNVATIKLRYEVKAKFEIE